MGNTLSGAQYTFQQEPLNGVVVANGNNPGQPANNVDNDNNADNRAGNFILSLAPRRGLLDGENNLFGTIRNDLAAYFPFGRIAPPPPVHQTSSIKSLINLHKDSVQLLRLPHNDGEKESDDLLYKLAFIFDATEDCEVRIIFQSPPSLSLDSSKDKSVYAYKFNPLSLPPFLPPHFFLLNIIITLKFFVIFSSSFSFLYYSSTFQPYSFSSYCLFYLFYLFYFEMLANKYNRQCNSTGTEGSDEEREVITGGVEIVGPLLYPRGTGHQVFVPLSPSLLASHPIPSPTTPPLSPESPQLADNQQEQAEDDNLPPLPLPPSTNSSSPSSPPHFSIIIEISCTEEASDSTSKGATVPSSSAPVKADLPAPPVRFQATYPQQSIL